MVGQHGLQAPYEQAGRKPLHWLLWHSGADRGSRAVIQGVGGLCVAGKSSGGGGGDLSVRQNLGAEESEAHLLTHPSPTSPYSIPLPPSNL